MHTPRFLLALLIHPTLHVILPFLDLLRLSFNVRRSNACRLRGLASSRLKDSNVSTTHPFFKYCLWENGLLYRWRFVA